MGFWSHKPWRPRGSPSGCGRAVSTPGRARRAVWYFPHNLLVAVDAERATFVFAQAGGRDGERGPRVGLVRGC